MVGLYRWPRPTRRPRRRRSRIPVAYEQEWRRTTPRERSAYLRAAAGVIRNHAEELAELEAREVGKPRRDALRFDVSYSSAAFDTTVA
jgi:acyl-CoA reductase-like NAD-dependent aldehyde dehydrogenase